ncbi:MAG TPA: RluA family pseudouridine synthase [Dehalococcoidia bacterium]|nr:RluA family pseudouridine synthase [Dehalococcoidia bacterium]
MREALKEIELRADRPRERLDRFVSRAVPELSRARVQRLIDEGLVTVEGRAAKPSRRLNPGERVRVVVPPPEPVALEPEALPLCILYEDADLLVVDKPAGMPVHPGPGHLSGTLVNAVLAHCPDLSGIGGALRPGIVHRLDKDTSGLIIVAKNDRTHQALQRQLKERAVEKRYVALVRGDLRPDEGVIDAPIARDPRYRKRMAVVPGGREAITRWRVLQRFVGPGSGEPRYTLVEARPVTGRTHQIRVHFASLRHPLVGDALYGRRSALVERQFLHAAGLAFVHPSTGRRMEFESPLPDDLRMALRALRPADGATA